MSKGRLREGERWGAVQFIGATAAKRTTVENGVASIKAQVRYRFQCDCLTVFEVWDGEWKGKRLVKDCGCGRGLQKDATVMQGFSLPVSIVQRLDAAVYKRGLNKSQLLRDLVILWLSGQEETEEKNNGKADIGKSTIPTETDTESNRGQSIRPGRNKNGH